MTRKRLNKDDLSLWQKVTERTEKLDVNQLFRPEIDAPAPSLPKIRKTTSVVLGKPTPKPRSNAHDLMPSLPDQIRKSPVQMDSKAFGRLKRGKIRPEGRIDLHGMTLDRAHPALTKFILGSHAKGRRLVLVITGKGKMRDEGGPIPVRHGVLRHQVPQWLSMPPLSAAVLQVSQAHISHGGGGAYYVYLRRHR
ncbi:MAG: Smr/MutS family protein [Sulfitobacter sp.]|jgi:DNA-nicking Smr family endonuclease|uniref:Smr/MutS family protein n=1 Tax=Sulfitobacter sp. TaxID=1903071 RepID=UPI000C122419|nr:DNA mismatch repair protein MutS [Roseobacter sp.]MBV49303.1 DNA mismatch repair protein MutS [Roseobacter sp.]PHR09862.1 MAG: DNA mismatch repair protein MutS [Sulfitobacter sp.]|tara:strand:- start:8078 stop:8659 length:582 start_codon:yes stop_codon:yes gene_type:complete